MQRGQNLFVSQPDVHLDKLLGRGIFSRRSPDIKMLSQMCLADQMLAATPAVMQLNGALVKCNVVWFSETGRGAEAESTIESRAGCCMLPTQQRIADEVNRKTRVAMAAAMEVEEVEDDQPLQRLGQPRPHCWARESRLTLPLSAALPKREASMDAIEAEEEHWAGCQAPECPRCYFEAGFAGMLRRGARNLVAPCQSHSWAQRFSFKHPVTGQQKTWLAQKTADHVPPWGMGCWICLHYEPERYGSSFARLAVCAKNTVSPSSFRKHEQSDGHRAAVKSMVELLLPSEEPVEQGQFTGASDTVPRLEKFHLAAMVVSRHDSFTDFSEYIKTLRMCSPLSFNGDISRQACAKMIMALAAPLYLQDQAVMRKATVAALSFDARDDIMLVRARFFYEGLRNNGHLPATGLYECVLGSVRKTGTGAQGSAASVELILKQSCVVRAGRRGAELASGPEDRLDEALFTHLKACFIN